MIIQATEYPILNLVLSDCLRDRFQEERDELMELYSKLSTERASALVAAYLALLAAREWVQLEQEVHGATEESPTTRTYDELVNRSINADLVEMSKTRTLITDIHKIKQAEERIKAEPGYLWKALYYVVLKETH